MSVKPQLDWMFAVPLFQQQLPDFDHYRTALITELRKIKQSSTGVRRSNVGGWHSVDLRSQERSAPIDWLLTAVLEFARSSLSQMKPRPTDLDLQFDAIWAIINQRGDWNTVHNHLPSQWSGVAYIKVDDAMPDQHNGNLILIDPYPLGPTFRQPINAFIAPRSGGIFLFPSYLNHMVEPYQGTEERIVVSFNLRVGTE